jgi:hypothetical protein
VELAVGVEMVGVELPGGVAIGTVVIAEEPTTEVRSVEAGERAVTNLIKKALAIWACLILVGVIVAVANTLLGRDVVDEHMDTYTTEDYTSVVP